MNSTSNPRAPKLTLSDNSSSHSSQEDSFHGTTDIDLNSLTFGPVKIKDSLFMGDYQTAKVTLF